jgi:hypothetical protein|tara:strand:- start:5240 stop:5512 length:273 start_codon:yes stop_codon:yes gene_type:complete
MPMKLNPELWIKATNRVTGEIEKYRYFICDKLLRVYTKNKIRYFVFEYGNNVRYQLTVSKADLAKYLSIEYLIHSLDRGYSDQEQSEQNI